MARVLAKELREAVLQAAMQGKLTSQLETDTSVQSTFFNIQNEKEQLIKNKLIKKEKKLSNIEENEIPFDIPNCWEWKRLGEVALTNIGLTYRPQDISDEGTLVLRSSNIKNGRISYSDNVYVSMEIPESSKIHKGDILICVRNGSRKLVGKAAIVDEEGMAFGAFMAKIHTKWMNINYIKYYLESHAFRGALDDVKTETINQITQTMLKNKVIPIPPIEEQARIVAKVDEIMAKIDEYEKLENQLVKLKEQFPQDMKDSLLQAGMMGKLTEQLETDTPVNLNLINQAKNKQLEASDIETPRNWAESSIEGISESISTKKYQIKDSQVLKEGKYKVVSQSQQETIGYSNSDDKLFHHKLPVITFGDHTTIVKLIDFEFVVGADGLKIFKPNAVVMPKYFYYSLEHLCNGLENVGGYTRHYKYIKNKPIPIPPIEEQQRIVDKLDELLPLVDKLAELN